jgi:phosphoenolpyruvate---glycerone phosphotransferase subunit DhaL
MREMIGRSPTALDRDLAAAWVTRFICAFERREPWFSDLDRQSGDGDFGVNVRTALTNARNALAATEPGGVGEVFNCLARGFLQVGGTSGPLFAVWFGHLAGATSEQPHATLPALAASVHAGTAAVQRLGGAKPGDKTMVDAMVPVAAALRKAAEAELELRHALEHAAMHAQTGAAATRELQARRGRASYIASAGQGVIDPGAATVALFFETGAAAITESGR